MLRTGERREGIVRGAAAASSAQRVAAAAVTFGCAAKKAHISSVADIASDACPANFHQGSGRRTTVRAVVHGEQHHRVPFRHPAYSSRTTLPPSRVVVAASRATVGVDPEIDRLRLGDDSARPIGFLTAVVRHGVVGLAMERDHRERLHRLPNAQRVTARGDAADGARRDPERRDARR